MYKISVHSLDKSPKLKKTLYFSGEMYYNKFDRIFKELCVFCEIYRKIMLIMPACTDGHDINSIYHLNLNGRVITNAQI